MSPRIPPLFHSCAPLVAIVLGAAGCTLEPQPIPGSPATPVEDPLAYVDPFIGSGGFAYAHGSAFPGAAAPFGLVKVGPDTRGPYGVIRFLHYSGYWYGDDFVQGFSHLHLHGTGATDYGVLSVMPTGAFDASRLTVEANEAHMDKAREKARPGYYTTYLDEAGIEAELSATRHGAHHRYTFAPGVSEGHLLFDLDHHLDSGAVSHAEVTLDPATGTIRGVVHSMGEMSDGFGGYDVFFDARARSPWKTARVWSEGTAPAEGLTANGKKVGFDLAFDLADGAPVELQVGISLVSLENAGKNRQAELPAWDFEATQQKTRKDWEPLVGAVRVFGGSDADRRIFYSSLYRAFLMPTASSDVDGSYRYGGQVRTAEGFSFLTDQSLWDTYRTVTPLYNLIAPEAARDTARSLHAMAEIGGFFPKWPIATGEAGTMLGASADIVMADTYIKGVTDFDAEGAYAILRAAAADTAEPPGGRGGREYAVTYMQHGYVPADIGRSASHTLEYAHDDLALANFAGALGLADDEAMFRERAISHRELFDPAVGFIRERNADGTFPPGFDPYTLTDHYAEANAWHSLWAQHDIPGVAELLGGQDAFVEKLGEFFDNAIADLAERPIEDKFASSTPRYDYWHGNETSIHAAYGFAQVGRPDLTQKYARWVMEAHYVDAPHGLAGNDDGGTLSSWYVFAAAGFYPIPGTDRYVIGAPLFPRMEIRVKGGTLVIEAPEASAENLYVQSVTWNEAPLDKPELRHGDIAQGGTLRFEMGPSPGAWGRTD
ncbi:GH92 family glycosyl hydrolase [Polyangium aurulentum]|uniref:GH92 family glycosyl hydrolase n=1 Tax=Polyangium aurulentum TaxID=2567896 RepID=UPI0010AE4FB5|nr:GH92 family glycosyl hydrolase [Polyangium aurulentum]UQA57659.1 GH92 family glycosyl hydrolase [Polyangium aurulentum]